MIWIYVMWIFDDVFKIGVISDIRLPRQLSLIAEVATAMLYVTL